MNTAKHPIWEEVSRVLIASSLESCKLKTTCTRRWTSSPGHNHHHDFLDALFFPTPPQMTMLLFFFWKKFWKQILIHQIKEKQMKRKENFPPWQNACFQSSWLVHFGWGSVAFCCPFFYHFWDPWRLLLLSLKVSWGLTENGGCRGRDIY